MQYSWILHRADEPATRRTHGACVKFGREMPDSTGFLEGEIGKRVFENVSRRVEIVDRALQM